MNMVCISLFFLIAISLSAFAEKEDEFTVSLSSETFDDALKTSNHFVMFYAPWCGHCKRLHPLWDQIAEMMNVDEPQVVIAKVDCTQHQELCSNHEITGYPTLKFFKVGSSESTKFKGTRDLPTITEFIQEQLGRKESEDVDNENTVPVHKLIELTDDTFNEHVNTGKHFIKFYAPWCSHCQRLAPTWEELSKSFENDKSVKIAKIDCTVYRPICQEFEVKGYPTLLWIENGKKIEKYSGGRAHDDLTTYVKTMLGTDPIVADNTEDNDTKTVSKDKVHLLTSDNFQTHIENGVTFIKFYAPWCGHCQKLSPVWDQLAAKIHTEKTGIKIAKVDCTLADNKQLCVEQQIEGYPTLLIYRNSEKLNEYNGSRHLDDLYEFAVNTLRHDEL